MTKQTILDIIVFVIVLTTMTAAVLWLGSAGLAV